MLSRQTGALVASRCDRGAEDCEQHARHARGDRPRHRQAHPALDQRAGPRRARLRCRAGRQTTPSSVLSIAYEPEQVPPRGAARPQQRQLTAITVDGAKRREIREAKPDQRPRNREHDVQGLGVERVAGGAVEVIGTGCPRT